ncbi:MAG: AlpA family transcriptional regulator [Chloroflexi bacterium]|nr:AlpA family transcriptional regulator [Chloroflexota bacterium]
MRRRILRLPEVLELTGLSRSTLYRRVEAGEFPQPVKLGGPNSRAVGWLEEDVSGWLGRLEPRR